MWVYGRDGPPSNSIVLFEYDPTRNKEVPKRLLEDYRGYLQVDGYASYDEVCLRNEIIRIGCMAHCRRKFHDAWIEASKADGKAKDALIYIKRLYKIEDRIKNENPQVRYEVRQRESKPILNEMKLWIDQYVDRVLSSNKLGEAFGYAYNQWEFLTRYIEDGNLSIDNNFIENKIRPFALGRRNWLFSDTVDGAKASAIIYSIVQTAIANGFEPWKYLCWVLKEIPNAKTLEDFERLLPLKQKI